MKDIIAKYQKQNILKNTGLIAMSLALAFGINFSIQGTSLGDKIQANVLNSQENIKVGDLYLKNDGTIKLFSNKKMIGVKSISFTIFYNPVNVKIAGISSKLGGQIINQGNELGTNTIIINFSNPIDIEKGENISDLSLSKINNIQNIENINLMNANFSDTTGELFMLSTSGIEY